MHEQKGTREMMDYRYKLTTDEILQVLKLIGREYDKLTAAQKERVIAYFRNGEEDKKKREKDERVKKQFDLRRKFVENLTGDQKKMIEDEFGKEFGVMDWKEKEAVYKILNNK